MKPVLSLLLWLAGSAASYSARAQASPAPPAAPASCLAVSGYVTHDGQPLVGVSVMVRKTNLLTTTNGDGYFLLPLKGATPTELFFDAAGYEPQTLPMTCRPVQLELQLLPGTRIRQRGKRKGQIKKVGTALTAGQAQQ